MNFCSLNQYLNVIEFVQNIAVAQIIERDDYTEGP